MREPDRIRLTDRPAHYDEMPTLIGWVFLFSSPQGIMDTMTGIPTVQDLVERSAEEALTALESSPDGIPEMEARKRLFLYEPNEFHFGTRVHLWNILISKFKNPVLLVLVAAAVVSAFLGSTLDSFIIIGIVMVSGLIDFFNTYKSEKAVERLEDQVRITVAVKRGGEFVERPLRDIVPGDVFSLVAGDLVPADSVVLDSKDLFVNESVVTGESLPIEKGRAPHEEVPLFMGTSVVSGECTALAVTTGKKTKIGQIAGHLVEKEEPSEFEKNLGSFSYFIFRLTVVLVAVIIGLNIALNGKNIFDIFLFAVAIAVGIAPELLPMIVTANLARGALAMSRHGVIVKNLSAIHNFGSIDVLCTDKTGTLTEDKITLIKYLDGLGGESEKVLLWGQLSSHYTSGVRRTLDVAIREFRSFDVGGWEKVDEIPFDFERKRESVVVRKGDDVSLIAKGAPEEILRVCKSYGEDRQDLTDELREKIGKEYDSLSEEGFRVLAVALKTMPVRDGLYHKDDECDLVFMGFLAFMDPPKHAVKEVLRRMVEHHVGIKIITGDNHRVARTIARELSLPVEGVLSGDDITRLSGDEFRDRVEGTTIFSRVTPEQKEAIINALRSRGRVVGYLGDGVNDVLALKAADVGISVDNATQIAKETADIILLRRGLHEVLEGVVEGRRTFANTFKYLMMALSSNFGNMFSMPVASLFLNFLPMTPTQIILNNFLYDTSQFAIPFDRVEPEFVMRAKKFDIHFIQKFMVVFGPLSSLFDLITFFTLFVFFGLTGAAFQTGWFLESIATQTLVVGVIRARNIVRNRPSFILVAASLIAVVVGWALPYSPLGHFLGFEALPLPVLGVLWLIIVGYLVAVEAAKHLFYRRYGHLIER